MCNCRSLFVLFLLVIVLSVLLWFNDYDYPFAIFTPFFKKLLFYFSLLIPFNSLENNLRRTEKAHCHLRSAQPIRDIYHGTLVAMIFNQEQRSLVWVACIKYPQIYLDTFEFHHLIDLIIFQFNANNLMIINPNK